jgi:hypothetical protein
MAVILAPQQGLLLQVPVEQLQKGQPSLKVPVDMISVAQSGSGHLNENSQKASCKKGCLL